VLEIFFRKLNQESPNDKMTRDDRKPPQLSPLSRR
jgi:hypothetical protein